MSANSSKPDSNGKPAAAIQQNIGLLHELFKQIIDRSEKILVVISDKSIVYANPRATTELGFSKKTSLGIPITDVFIPSQGGEFFGKFLAMEANLKSKSSDTDPIKAKSASGDERAYTTAIRRCYWKGKPSVLLALSPYQDSLNEWGFESPIRSSPLIAMANVFGWEYNLETGDFFIDKKFFEHLNISPKGNPKRIDSWQGNLSQESRIDFEKILTSIKINKKPLHQLEYTIFDKDNNKLTILSSFEVVDWDRYGNPEKLAGAHVLINMQNGYKKQGSNGTSLKGFIMNTIEGLVVVDSNGVIQEWNPAQEKLTLINRDQAVGKHLLALRHSLSPEQKPVTHYVEELNELFDGIKKNNLNPWEGKLYESRILLSNGSIKHIQHSIFTVDSDKGKLVVISNKDITESKQSHEKLEKSEERLKLALAASNVGIWDIDMITKDRHFSPMIYAIFGYRPFELEPSEELWNKHIHPEDIGWVNQKVKTLMASGNNMDMEFRVIRKDGEIIWLQSKTRVIRDERNKLLRVTGTLSDVTRQKTIETELRRSEESLRKNIEQHEVVSNISYTLNTNKPFEEKIDYVLQTLGQFTQASRVYIFENNYKKGITKNAYEWCNQGVAPQIEQLQEVPLSLINGWPKENDFLMSRNLSRDLPPDLSRLLIEQEIESIILFRLFVEGNEFGFMGFDECGYRRIWTKTEIELLRTISSLISFAYERERKR
jgi:PAS domain S-box-containing protein